MPKPVATFDTMQKFCKQFRELNLSITLSEMQKQTGVKISTISAFENGRSNNLNHLYLYINCCKTEGQEKVFLAGIENNLKKGK